MSVLYFSRNGVCCFRLPGRYGVLYPAIMPMSVADMQDASMPLIIARGPVPGQYFSLIGCQHADTSDLHSDGADVGKSAQCKCSDNYGFFLYEGSCVFQGVEVGVGDKFVEYHLGSQQAADGCHVFFTDAHEPCQRGENPPGKCLEVELYGSPV